MGNTIKKKRKIKNMKAEITITINNHNYRATTTLDDCLGDGEMHGSTRCSFDILTQALRGMMSEVCNMVEKSEFKEEESEGKRSTRETEINLYGHGRNEDNKECCTIMGGSRMSKRIDNVKQYCTLFEPMVYSATDNSACVIAEGHYRDIPFVVVNARHNHPCAYVNVAQTKLNGSIKVDLDCHGGITYSDENLPIRNEHGWWLGWDYAHWGDYSPLFLEGDEGNKKKWTTEEVVEECLNVIDAVWDYDTKEGGTE